MHAQGRAHFGFFTVYHRDTNAKEMEPGPSVVWGLPYGNDHLAC